MALFSVSFAVVRTKSPVSCITTSGCFLEPPLQPPLWHFSLSPLQWCAQNRLFHVSPLRAVFLSPLCNPLCGTFTCPSPSGAHKIACFMYHHFGLFSGNPSAASSVARFSVTLAVVLIKSPVSCITTSDCFLGSPLLPLCGTFTCPSPSGAHKIACFMSHHFGCTKNNF